MDNQTEEVIEIKNSGKKGRNVTMRVIMDINSDGISFKAVDFSRKKAIATLKAGFAGSLITMLNDTQ